MTDYYKILEVSKDATLEEIKSAFRRLAHLYHPDVSSLPNSRDMFLEINEAYNYLVKKISLENELSYKGTDSIKETAQIIIDLWMKSEREKIRERAKKYADYKFSRFKFTKIYRTTTFLTRWIAIGTFIFGIIILFDAAKSTIKVISKYEQVGFSYIASSFIIILLGVLITVYSAYKIYITFKKED
jgi:hypothetical protein